MNFEEDDRISPTFQIPDLFNLIDRDKNNFINELKEVVSIPSVSDNLEHSDGILRMLNYCSHKLEELGATIDSVDGNSEKTTNLPPVLFASLLVDDQLTTICVYGSVDTLLIENETNDKHSPYELIEENGRLYGCGVSDNKAPLLCWLNALKIYQLSKIKIPVNIKFVIEGTSESYSKSLFNAIYKKREFFKNVEYICFTIDKRVNELPCLKYGYRGLCRFGLIITCGQKRVHSGTFGGAFNQPLMDAVNIIGSLTNKHGKIMIPEFLKDIKPITEKDERLCRKEQCSIKDLKEETGMKSLCHKDIPSRIIMHKTRLPNLTVHSFHIKSKSADKDDHASIPNIIKANFSVRLVPNQNTRRTHDQFQQYIEKIWTQYKSANTYELKMHFGFDPWQEDPSTNHYAAAEAAIKTVYKVAPKYICEGTTMPAVSIFNSVCPASNMIVMPISGHNDNHHSKSESISVDNYIQGIKLVIAYMCEIHELNYK